MNCSNKCKHIKFLEREIAELRKEIRENLHRPHLHIPHQSESPPPTRKNYVKVNDVLFACGAAIIFTVIFAAIFWTIFVV